MDIGHGGTDVAPALLALAEGATDGRGPSGVLTMLVGTAERLLGVAAGAATGGPDGADPGSFVASTGDPGGAFAAAFEVGPGNDCLRTGRPVLCDDVTTERVRWLRFVAKATGEGLRGVWVLPVRRGDELMGALLLGGTSERGRPDLAVAGLLAEAAAVGLRHAHALHRAEALGDQLRGALQSRIAIEQAKGALAVHAGLDADEAFAALRGYARRRGLVLTDLARRVVAGEVDPAVVTRGGPPRGPRVS